MKDRCSNKNNKEYKHYGGKGVRVIEEWHNFKNFKEWALSHGYSSTLTIERIDIAGNYEPSNCKWIPLSEQLKNTSRTVHITYKGTTKCAMDWCKELGLPNNVVIARFRAGLPIEAVFAKRSFRGLSIKQIKEMYCDRC
jgi:hypothetical protein